MLEVLWKNILAKLVLVDNLEAVATFRPCYDMARASAVYDVVELDQERWDVMQVVLSSLVLPAT